MGKRKDCWNEGEEAQGFKEFPCKDDEHGRCACDLEELAEISLAFAREVAGYPEAVLEDGRVYSCPFPGDVKCMLSLPTQDYANDWNATIAALLSRELFWSTDDGFVFHVFSDPQDIGPASFGDGSTPRALCLAAIKCVRESKG